MKDFDCDIIYDLLPSYLDGICTGATRACVEGHLENCPACAARARQLRDTAVSGEGLERIALETANRIKRRTFWRTAGQLALALPFLFFAALGLNLFLWPVHTEFTYRLLGAFFPLLAACLLVCAVFLRGREPGLQKADRRALGLSLLAMAAGTGLTLYIYTSYIVRCLRPGSSAPTLFGITGRVSFALAVRVLYGALFLLQAALFLWALRRLWRQGVHTVPVLQSALTGMALPMLSFSVLCSLNLDGGPEPILYAQLRQTGAALLLGAAGAALGLLLATRRVRRY